MAGKAREFFCERGPFLTVHVVPTDDGRGWDLMLRVDGTYSNDEPGAEAQKAYMESVILEIMDDEDVPDYDRPRWSKP